MATAPAAPTPPPADGPAFPTPPSTSDPDNFDSRADAAFAAMGPLQSEFQATKANVHANAQSAYANALDVAANTAAVATNTALAASYAGAAPWVSGTTYAQFVVVSSPADNGRLYRKRTTAAGNATDPKNNPTDWAPVNAEVPVELTTAAVVRAVSGCAYGLTNATAQGAATNLLLYSNQINNAAWAKTNLTVSADYIASPTGDVDAERLVESATNSAHYVGQSVAAVSNVPFALSCIARAWGRTAISLQLDDGVGVNLIRAKYDLTSGMTSSVTNGGTGTGASAGMVLLGHGWWLCHLTGTCSTANSGTLRAHAAINDFIGYAGDGASGILIAQAQLESGSIITSRIDTGATAVTRAAGVIAPQRVILPALVADACVDIVPMNGVANIVDPDDASFYMADGTTYQGPIQLNNPGEQYRLRAVNGLWRFTR